MSSDRDDTNKQTSNNSDLQDPGEKLKKKIFSTIEGFMDQAMTEWNKIPQEKKNRVFHKMKNGGWFGDMDQVSKNKQHQMMEPKKKGKDEIAVGLAVTCGFAIALWMTNFWFLIFPLIFVGLIPLSVGLSKLFKKKVMAQDRDGSSHVVNKEKEILSLAKQLGGKFTVLQIASETSLSIEEARTTLDTMVKKGYIQLTVLDSGILRYEIPEFFHEPEKDDVEKRIDEL